MARKPLTVVSPIYSIALTVKEGIKAEHDARTRYLVDVSGEPGPMGLTKDEVKATPEWRAAFRAEREWFAHMQKYNRQFLVQHGTEYRKHARAQREARRAEGTK